MIFVAPVFRSCVGKAIPSHLSLIENPDRELAARQRAAYVAVDTREPP